MRSNHVGSMATVHRLIRSLCEIYLSPAAFFAIRNRLAASATSFLQSRLAIFSKIFRYYVYCFSQANDSP